MVLDEAKSQLQVAREQAQSQREEISKRREELVNVEGSITSQERKLPVPTQKTLRAGLFAGLEGRKRRRIISEMKKGMGKRREEIGLVKGELSRYEKETLDPFEAEISQKESDITKYEEKVNQFNYGYKLAVENKFIPNLTGEAQRGYDAGIAKMDYYSAVNQISIPLIGDTTITKDIRPIVNGVPVTFTPNPSAYSQIGSTFGGGGLWIKNRPRSYMPSVQSITKPRNLGRIDTNKFLSSFNRVSLPPISGSAVSIDSFKTTGSPIRITKLNSLYSRGHTDYQKRPTKIPTSKIIKQQKAPKFSKKLNLLSAVTKDKKKKKSSIWEF